MGARARHRAECPDQNGPRGLVPDELQQATEQMQLGAEFSTHAFGFDR